MLQSAEWVGAVNDSDRQWNFLTSVITLRFRSIHTLLSSTAIFKDFHLEILPSKRLRDFEKRSGVQKRWDIPYGQSNPSFCVEKLLQDCYCLS